MNARIRLIGVLFVATSTLALAGCGSEATQPSPAATQPSPAPPKGLGEIIQGVVRAVRPRSYTTQPPLPPGLSNATVTVTEGLAKGLTVTADAFGAYSLKVPEGPFRLRVSRSGYVTAETAEQNSTGNGARTMPDITLATAPWSIAGTVTDGVGNALQGITVTVSSGSFYEVPYGTVISGADGRYRLGSTRPHYESVTTSASATGFRGGGINAPCCNPPVDAVGDIRLQRVVNFVPHAPDTVRVDDQVKLPIAEITFDDGTSGNFYSKPTTTGPVQIINVSGYQGWVLQANAPGSAELTFEAYGLRRTLSVLITP